MMDGGFWAGSVPPWASVIIVLVCMATFVLGVAAGMDLERRQAARDAREERCEKEAEAEADAYLDALRPVARDWLAGYNRIRQQGVSVDPPRLPAAVDYDTSYDATGWDEHVGQGLAAASDPITTGEIRAITEDMDVFMARLLGEHPVPYLDGSGQ